LLRNENGEYKKLEEDHRRLETGLDDMLKKKYLTPDEEVEKRKSRNRSFNVRTVWPRLSGSSIMASEVNMMAGYYFAR